MTKKYALYFLFFLIIVHNSFAQQARAYLMHPDINGNQLVFVAEGDIWKTTLSGGEAVRLTTHPGDESFPKISPDGKWVAYAATYEGPTEVYLIPISGGLPKRMTYEPAASIPTDWKSPTELAYVTNQYSTLPRLNTVLLNIETGNKDILPLDMAAEGSFNESGDTFYFVRPTFHNNVTKRYEGGTARQVWKYTAGQAEAVKLTKDYKGEDHHPIHHGGRVYFISSRDGIQNVWSMDENASDLKQHSKQPSYDVREASLHSNNLVYRSGADLYHHDLASGQEKKLPISLTSDFDQLREYWIDNPASYVTHISLSNDGEKVALTARGRVFVFPSKQGRSLRLSQKDGVRYRDAVFSSDGKDIFAFSDESGEFEIHQYSGLGLDQGKQLTKDGNTLRFGLMPSPDGKKLAYHDLNNDLWIHDLTSGKKTKVTASDESIQGAKAWSPDSKWLAYGQAASNTFMQLFIFNSETGKRIPLTSDRTNSMNPQWSADGNWIYFLSDRNFESRIGSPWGTRQPEPFWEKQIKIYQVGLKKGLVSPFQPKNELKPVEEKKGNGPVAVTIDEEGLMERVREVPVPAGNYKNLVVTDKALYYHRVGSGMGVYYGGGASNEDNPALMMTPIDETAEQKVFADKVNSFVTSSNNKYAVLRVGSNHYVVELGTSPISDLSKSQLNLSGWKFSIDPREDWKQIYTDAWRMERDYFYDKNMHGVNWDAMYQKYLPLVDCVTTRRELSDVMGELIGELSVLHTSVGGGDLRSGDDQIQFGMLGGRFSKNEKLKGYNIDHIFLSDPDYPNEMSPLSHPDMNIAKGDVITHIDGVAVIESPDMMYLLRDKANKQVRIKILSSAGADKGDRIIIPMTASAESNLRYNEWEYSRRLMAEEKSDGDIGYVHLRAMTAGDISQWYRDFYPQFKKSGLVIDVRQNRGGNIDSFILEKLMREVFFYWKSRTGEPYYNMPYAFRGHLVLLVDEFTASDGEAFAEGFRRLDLGKSIGARTWGGEVWLSGVNTLTDNGVARAPMNGVYGEEGEWLIEGVGFIPDIEVINLPKATFDGGDAQLDAAIEHLKALIKSDPRPVPAPPTYPDKSFKNRKQ
ncbi:S41 family peptidase [Aquiflexum sp. TKW24L]|uniref:S41 family peptidase n=1 Tax=Aquiflexum sp. TKW24L TaxID=2942212 RepID=UPI0020C0657F|nr:S41 family peptidase [Aquiflexum sp. TKW24L]MCL6257630.1 S41 family peptidase [Aquiflexum sp. TKW24L]